MEEINETDGEAETEDGGNTKKQDNSDWTWHGAGKGETMNADQPKGRFKEQWDARTAEQK